MRKPPFKPSQKPKQSPMKWVCGGEEGTGADVESFAKAKEETERANSDEGQANKSARGMPWHQEPTKDVTSCDKLRGAANEL